MYDLSASGGCTPNTLTDIYSTFENHFLKFLATPYPWVWTVEQNKASSNNIVQLIRILHTVTI